MRRGARLRRLVSIVAITTLPIGCEAAGRPGNTLVVGVGTDVGNLMPVIESSSLDSELDELLYLSLNSARWSDGALEYVIDDLSLARRWEFDADSTTLIYHLREDAVWSDGEPVDAGDVVFTYELARRPEVASPYAEFWQKLDSVTALDQHRVAFFFSRRYPAMLYHTALGIVPAHVFGSASDRAALAGHPTLTDPERSPVVSGPFRVARHVSGERLVLEPNPRAFTTRPALDRVVLRIIPEQATRLIELQNGTVDVLAAVPLPDARAIDADPRFRIEMVEDRYYEFIAWNGERFAPFADPDVRRAMSLAIDRRAILEALDIDRYAKPAAGPYPPIFGALVDPTLAPDPYRPDSARALLAGKGWADHDGDGTLDRNGRPFRFTLLIRSASPRHAAIAELVQARFRAIGIEMEIRRLEFHTLWSLCSTERDCPAVLMSWQVGLEPDYLVGPFTPSDHPYNITGYSSPAVDRLIAEAQSAVTAAEAAPYWREAARTIAADRPYAFLWFYGDAVALAEHVTGARIDTYGAFQNLHHWRVERDPRTAAR